MNRKNGKSWHPPKPRFTPSSHAPSTYEKRIAATTALKEVKAHEASLKEEKEAERRRRIEGIKAKREKREEEERWRVLEEKMHRKRVERRRRREGRNKLLKS